MHFGKIDYVKRYYREMDFGSVDSVPIQIFLVDFGRLNRKIVKLKGHKQ